MDVLAVIEHASRRVRVLGTAHPSTAWVARAVRNLAMDLADAGHTARYLIRDRDGKFPALFDAILADADIRVVLSGVRMPRMNSIMERWIQGCRHELLDRTLVWNRRHLPHPLHEYESHHHAHRPHRGISNARPLHPFAGSDHRTRHDHPPRHLIDVTVWAVSAMSTNMPRDLHGRDFGSRNPNDTIMPVSLPPTEQQATHRTAGQTR